MKKFLSIFLSATIIFTVFAGCSASNGKSSLDITLDSNIEMQSDVVKAYKSVCKAIMQGKETVDFSKDIEYDVNLLLKSQFPLINLVDYIRYNEKNEIYDISYKNSVEEHKTLVKNFSDKCNSIIKTAKETAKNSDVLFVMNIYKYFAQSIKDKTQTGNSYMAIMNNSGQSSAVSSAFEYILIQSGINAAHIIGSTKDGAYAVWSAVEIDDKYYFFDPYSESVKNGGNGLRYFGQTLQDKVNDGYSEECLTIVDEEAPECTDERFEIFKNSIVWAVDESDNSKVNITYSDGNYKQISVKEL